MNSEKMKSVGKYKAELNDILGINLPCTEIYCSVGLIHHIAKRHPDCVEHYSRIPEVIENPDMVGVDPTKPNSVELIKQIGPYLLVAVTLDSKEGYLYVSSMYDQTPDKNKRRLKSGRYIEL